MTVVILTLNEEDNIRRCVSCVHNAEQVVVVDSFSSDKTIENARSIRSDAKILQHSFRDFADQRNWALNNITPPSGWVLFVDADEFCTEALLDEVRNFVGGAGDNVGAYVSGKNYFFNRWLRFSTMYPFYQLRLLKWGKVKFEKVGHGQREVTSGQLGYLKESWRHESFSKGVAEWVARHNRYTTDEASLMLAYKTESIDWKKLVLGSQMQRRRQLKVLSARLPCRPLVRFVYVYLLKGGFRDGYPGLLYCLLLLANQIVLSVKMKELREKNRAL